MSETIEYFKILKEYNKEKKQKNMAQSTELLKARGIEFEPKNNGNHLVVIRNGKTADFWPSTGKYIIRKGKKGRGVFNLLRDIGIKKC